MFDVILNYFKYKKKSYLLLVIIVLFSEHEESIKEKIGTLVIGNIYSYLNSSNTENKLLFVSIGRDDRYTILEHIKSGEFGEIFKVHDSNKNMLATYFIFSNYIFFL